ncbi:MAG: alpha/beta hydrolase-fold protein [Segetibacter sp.]
MKKTMTQSVQVMDPAFYMPQLGRHRRIWLYLPQTYYTSEKRYPVIYMHDGQNLFDASAAAFGEEWQVDETMDQLGAECIIVGIDNGGDNRMKEYNFYDHPEFGPSEGRQYIDFIADTLKPYIDHHYRTIASREGTFTAGASMGGLISFFALFHYPHVFSGGGIFSPSLWLVPGLQTELRQHRGSNRLSLRYFFYAGEKEGAGMVENLLALTKLLKKDKLNQIHTTINPEGEHSEPTWGAQLPQFWAWMETYLNK